MRASLFLILPLLLLLACDETRDRPSGNRDAGTNDPDAGRADLGVGDAGTGSFDELVECPNGSTLTHYSLSALANLPGASELEFPGLPFTPMLLGAGSGSASNGRFDFCKSSGGALSVQAVLWTTDDFSTPTYYLRDETISSPVEEYVEYRGGMISLIRMPASAFAVTGASEAVGGNLEPLELRMIHDNGLLVLGHAGFVAGATGMVTATSINYNSVFIVAGGLAEGDVYAGRPCPFGERIVSKTWRMGTADFTFVACTFLGGGETYGYRISRLSIIDSNSALTPAERETFTFEGEAAVEAVMNYQWNHHNACDSFHLALPHADYAATTSPAAGCGTAVPNAPMRDIEDPPGEVLYRVRYHGGEWTEGSTPGCHHYLFCI